MASNKRGFTLIELLIVIVILGILAVVLMNPVTQLKKARDSQRKSNLREIKTSLVLYYSIHGAYPENDGDGKIIGCGEPVSSCDWGAKWERDNVVFMKILPDDPLDTPDYQYTQVDDENFYLIAILEIDSDPSAAKSQAKCGVGLGNEYVVCQD